MCGNVLHAFSPTLKRKSIRRYKICIYWSPVCFRYYPHMLSFFPSRCPHQTISVQTRLHWLSVKRHLIDQVWGIITGEEKGKLTQCLKSEINWKQLFSFILLLIVLSGFIMSYNWIQFFHGFPIQSASLQYQVGLVVSSKSWCTKIRKHSK